MSLQDKYSQLISYARSNVKDLDVSEKNNVLHLSGKASATAKDEIWKLYDKIDPDMRSGDLVLAIDVVAGSEEIYEVQAGDSLSKIAKKYSGMTWQKIYEANKDIISDPNVIYPKQKLTIPL
ncbi:MAG: LysM peptidoglycan-binding domain-containing protein [Bacteroidales bacterium]|jgi:nucleoid-associated protein YgaU|nr:LysM peptidoglycan-binding domain-containing protein [Bacteroidales bacterium]